MRLESREVAARIGRLVERIGMLEAALEQCRTLAERAAPETAPDYCEKIAEVARTALQREIV